MRKILEITAPNTPVVHDNKHNSFFNLSPYLDIMVSCSTKLVLPRSGRYFIEALKNVNFKNKKVLDIGTGFFGYLARHAEFFGAKEVVAVDINRVAIKYAKKHFKTSSKISFKISDVYSKLSERKKFDIIISNPPQLPSNEGGDIHDVGGVDGLKIIKLCLDDCSKFLDKQGYFYLLVFDFLYNQVKVLCKQHNLSCKTLAFYNKKIRKGGETEKRIGYIEKTYPHFKFFQNKEGYWHKVFILEIKHK